MADIPTTPRADTTPAETARPPNRPNAHWRWFALGISVLVVIAAVFAVDLIIGVVRFEKQLAAKAAIDEEFTDIRQGVLAHMQNDGVDLRAAIERINRVNLYRHGSTLGWISTDPAAWRKDSSRTDESDLPRIIMFVRVPDADEPVFWALDANGTFVTTNTMGPNESTFTALNLPPLTDAPWQP